MAWWEGYVSDDVMGMIAPVVLAVRGTVPHDATTGALQFSFRAETGGAELGQDSAGSERRSAGARGSSSGKLPRLCRCKLLLFLLLSHFFCAFCLRLKPRGR
jgi:hypothetical protein